MTGLKSLDFYGTSVTVAATRDLRCALPNVAIRHPEDPEVRGREDDELPF